MSLTDQHSKALLKKADDLFSKECKFIKTVTEVSTFSKAKWPEFAFLGRSNAGKSSLLNALINRKNLVYTSKTPGRTRNLNFFSLADQIFLVDLPGYGYAKVSDKEKKNWSSLIWSYLTLSPALKRIFLLIDARHGLKKNDEEILTSLSSIALSTQIILTKSDKTKPLELSKTYTNIQQKSQEYPVCHPDILITSSKLKKGLSPLRAEIYALTYPL